MDLPVNDVVRVQELQSTNDFGTVESGTILIEFSIFLNVKHKIATVQIFHHEEQVTLCGECENRIVDLLMTHVPKILKLDFLAERA